MLEVGDTFTKQGMKFHVIMIRKGHFVCRTYHGVHSLDARCDISINSQERVTLITKKLNRASR